MQNYQELTPSSIQYLKRFDLILQDMIRGMTNPKPAGSISGLFIRQMIPHHEAAIRMSENLLNYTMPSGQKPAGMPRNDRCGGDIVAPLNKIAENIIKEQTESIRNMESAFYRCSQCENTCREIHAYQTAFQQITQTMFSQMRQAPRTDRIPYDFIREMIPHHMGAIRMSENALRFRLCPELIPILDAIITSQKKGVQEMKALLD